MSARVPILFVTLVLLFPLCGAAGEVRQMVFGKGGSGVSGVDGLFDEVDDVLEECGTPVNDRCITQVDGGQSGDASNVCSAPSPDVLLGTSFTGLLAPGDLEDDYALIVPAGNTDVLVSILTTLPDGVETLASTHSVTAWGPSGCAVNRGTAYPGVPLIFTAPSAGTYTLQVKAEPSVHVQNCHVMCALTNLTGYEITTGG